MSTGKSSTSPMAATPAPDSGKPRNNRRAGRLFAGFGAGIGVLGGAAVVVGGVLPWAQFAVFGVPFALPGLLSYGALTAGAGLLGLTYARRFPLLGVVFGLVALMGGIVARQTVGKGIVKTLLHIERTLAPVNARLAEAALPPVDPFPSIRPAQEYVGTGPLWTIWGGSALAIGSACRFAGGRLRRSCAACGVVWDTQRADTIVFCPRCGVQSAPALTCIRCHAAVQKNDLFCWRCGLAPTQKPS